ncbi:MAG TPA: alpha-L-arabinofuranosidase C-terminal domain-containing protein [Opitutaceae bacterium]|nr:alpha-L-arabinofuranosidase C-terminal domain-containing protein [Opitutaceae bacterium]
MKPHRTALFALASLAVTTAALAQMPGPPKAEKPVAVSSAPVPPATIRIDVDHVIARIDPRIYGVFMEPIGIHSGGRQFHTLYGPVYDPTSPLADHDGFRQDIIDAAHELQITQMRWPGGNFTSAYDWRDGIGPKDQRPKRIDPAWGVVESNQVGTDEWMQLSKVLGTENIVCINGGTGTLDDARSWVEYCNAPAGSYWADKRVEYGHPQPYAVKIWDLGNEVDGAPWIMGYKDADDYIKFATEAAKIMRHTSLDTKLEFVACGAANYQDNFDWVEWDWKVAKAMYGIADYLSVHRYWDDSDDYYVFMGQRAVDLDEKITTIAGQLQTVADIHHGKPMTIAFDEWAPPFRHGGYLPTLALAQFFNAFIRHADVIKMANYTMLTSILSRDPKTDATYKSPTFYAFKLFSTHCRGTALDTFVDCATFDTSAHYTKIPFLDVSSVYDAAAKQVIINVVNRHEAQPITTDVQCIAGTFAGPASVSQIVGPVDNQPFTYAARAGYVPKIEEVAAHGSTLRYAFPAHSFTQIVVGVNK